MGGTVKTDLMIFSLKRTVKPIAILIMSAILSILTLHGYGFPHTAGRIYTQEELKRLDPFSLYRALLTAEPSLSADDKAPLSGSDPNGIPKTLRAGGIGSLESNGHSSPLILYDGFAISVEELFDLDINKIGTVAILKDPSSTAAMGVRAGSGAIVITSSAPAEGRLSLTYTMDGGFQRADLSSYDLMGAEDKLALEKRYGMYDAYPGLYEQRMAEVAGSGGTDWLRLPLRTAFRHKHTLTAQGGDGTVAYRAYLMAEPGGDGIMKGSSRERYSAAAYVSYHTGRFTVSNELSAGIVNGDHSPYGAFAQYATVNPYYSASNRAGRTIPVLGSDGPNPQQSPFYEASLSSFAEDKATRFHNNLNASWKITDEISLSGRFTFKKNFGKFSQYISPSSLVFSGLPPEMNDYKGTYQIIRNNSATYEEVLSLGYKTTRGQHYVSAAAGIEAHDTKYDDDDYTGAGMSSDFMNYISFAKNYAYMSRPGSKKYYHRVIGGFMSAAYIYGERYGTEVSVRGDRSSILSPEHRTAPSWSVRNTWDIGSERFMSGAVFVDKLVLSAGYGATAGYDFGYTDANPTYAYDYDTPYLSSGSLALLSLKGIYGYDSGLKWKTTQGFDAGVSAALYGRVSLYLKYYNNNTKNLLCIENREYYYGGGLKPANGGRIRNHGIEFGIDATVLALENGLRVNIFTNGLSARNKLSDAPVPHMDHHNENLSAEGTYMNLQRRGNAVDGVYAFRSAGIDPADGHELFYTREGALTKAPAISDAEYMGSATPKINGTFGLSGEYGPWSLACVFSYSAGARMFDYMNYLRLDVMESGNNGPKGMADKWSPGNPYGGHPAGGEGYFSSRHVSTLSTLTFSSLALGYEFGGQALRAMRMKKLRAAFTCNDLFHSSSVKFERGMIYPYARSFTLSLKAGF